MIDNGKGINVLSLFDGISCGQLALERAGIKVDKYFASEIDKHAVKVTPKRPKNGSVRETLKLFSEKNSLVLDLIEKFKLEVL